MGRERGVGVLKHREKDMEWGCGRLLGPDGGV